MKPRNRHYSGGEIGPTRNEDSIPAILSYPARNYGTNRHRWAIAHRARLIDAGLYVRSRPVPTYTITVSTACLIKHSMCPGRTWTDYGWTPCECGCHQGET